MTSRRDFLKKTLYVAPIIFTASVRPAFAGSAYENSGGAPTTGGGSDPSGEEIDEHDGSSGSSGSSGSNGNGGDNNDSPGGNSTTGGDGGGSATEPDPPLGRRRSKRSNFFEMLWDQIREI